MDANIVRPSRTDSASTESRSTELTGAERRVYNRSNSNTLVICQLVNKSKGCQFRGQVIDVSLSGACLLLPMRVDVNELLILDFLNLAYYPAFTAQAKIRWVQHDAEMLQWRVGCEFGRAVDLTELLALLQ